MEAREEKIAIAEAIINSQLNYEQLDLFEDENDFTYHLFENGDMQTQTGMAYALVNAYWHADRNYLYICNDEEHVRDVISTANKLIDSLKIHRPERKYSVINRNVYIRFGSTLSNIRIATMQDKLISNLHTKDDDLFFSEIITDTHESLTFEELKLLISKVPSCSKMVLMTKVEYMDSDRAPKKISRMDEIFKDSLDV